MDAAQLGPARVRRQDLGLPLRGRAGQLGGDERQVVRFGVEPVFGRDGGVVERAQGGRQAGDCERVGRRRAQRGGGEERVVGEAQVQEAWDAGWEGGEEGPAGYMRVGEVEGVEGGGEDRGADGGGGWGYAGDGVGFQSQGCEVGEGG